MHLEQVDVLRCPAPHEDSWLVAVIEQLASREIVRGTLGCPVCGAEYPVRGREVQMGGTASASVEPASTDEAMRMAALLDLAEPGGLALLAGRWGAHAPALRLLVDQRLLLLAPPASVAMEEGIYGLLAPAGVFPLG
ncbi:MAG TPA: hypothetical protein VEA99_14510, partial [Gemmatimonadaceae bacterium]|nr:hypothetical protein [Gemmatimonadaceae bacterium]